MLSVCRIEASHIHEQVDEYLPQDRMRSGTFLQFSPEINDRQLEFWEPYF